MIPKIIKIITVLCGTAAFAEDVQFRLDYDGANGVDDLLRFRINDVAAAFPNMQITAFEGENLYGGGPRMMALSRDNATVFIVDLAELERAYAFSIFTRSDKVAGPNGWRVGETVVSDVVGQADWECGRGYNAQAYRVSCMNWDESLRLLFEEQPQFSTDRIGSGTYDPVLGDAVLEEMRQYLSRPIQ